MYLGPSTFVKAAAETDAGMQYRLGGLHAGENWRFRKAAGGVLTAKQAPHRPGTAPALGLRAERVAIHFVQTVIPMEV